MILRLVRGFVAAIAISLLSLSAFAASLVHDMPPEAAKWRSEVSQEEFEALVRDKVLGISEMRGLWSKLEQSPEMRENTYLAGGAVRGLLDWLDLQLSEYSYSDVKKMKSPAFDDLIQEGADKDIFLTGKMKNELLPYYFQRHYGWDVLEDGSFLSDSRAAGGSTIEKIGVNPYKIFDPFGAIADFHAGKLTFNNAYESVFQRYRGHSTSLRGNSKTALVLRHLRFLVMFGGLEVTQKEIASLRRIVQKEFGDNAITAGNYWIQKSLKKFASDCHAADLDYAAVLSQTGLLEPLAKLKYVTEFESLEKGLERIQLAERGKGSFDAYLRLAKKPANAKTIGSVAAFMWSGIPNVRSADDMVSLLEFNSSNDYLKELISKLWETHVELFLSFRPTYKQVEAIAKYDVGSRLRDRIYSRLANDLAASKDLTVKDAAEISKYTRDGIYERVLIEALRRLKTPAELLEASRSLRGSSLESLMWLIEGRRFLDMKPSPKELAAFTRLDARSEHRAEASHRLVKLATTPDRIIETLRGGEDGRWTAPDDPFVKLWKDHVERFLAMRPTLRQILAAKAQTSDMTLIDRFVTAGLTRVETAAEFIALVRPPISFGADQREKHEKTILRAAQQFSSLNPSFAEARVVLGFLENGGYQSSLLGVAADRVSAASELLDVLAPRESHVVSPSRVDALWLRYGTKFVEFEPTSEEWARARDVVGVGDTMSNIEIAAMKRRRSLADVFTITGSVKMTDANVVTSFWSETAPKFLAANPRFEEVREIYEMTPSFAKQVPFWKLVARATSAAQMLQFYDWGHEIFGKNLSTYREFFWSANGAAFDRLNPTAEERALRASIERKVGIFERVTGKVLAKPVKSCAAAFAHR